jgi:hypothetical protein
LSEARWRLEAGEVLRARALVGLDDVELHLLSLFEVGTADVLHVEEHVLVRFLCVDESVPARVVEEVDRTCWHTLSWWTFTSIKVATPRIRAVEPVEHRGLPRLAVRTDRPVVGDPQPNNLRAARRTRRPERFVPRRRRRRLRRSHALAGGHLVGVLNGVGPSITGIAVTSRLLVHPVVSAVVHLRGELVQRAMVGHVTPVERAELERNGQVPAPEGSTMSEGTFWLVSELQTAVESFATAAGVDPLSAVLVALGGLITAAASMAFGALALGGILEALGDTFSRSPPPETN